ncbi:UDP-3-O-(3-hydroxymyristoyl)glucosamine N-acyltransferase [Roseisolibacter sp. H3M3-2]|uniref:UDP-3-O-(3-hydroxymyristoyl)glucosamine N-acyltransferase n=1 Tax=Roseisolibacter sp. H3M3-2 TaxID=3031323 RepID=UPI0023DB043A|nr:UDP-3-O-(3-hydroxymyristoyl)glucosamine N-acyltransferase [Roseisolibacter sp. H3M3-2]MDF1502648.1 UDP-3-O-(3-hydroxymyristoyl)glucosamine N-acyltransferase [Roseisolibacter sp. H3M3-2]
MTADSPRAEPQPGTARDATRGGGEDRQAPVLTAAAVAQMVGGALRDAADADRPVRRMATLEAAGADDVTFYANGRYADAFARTRAGVVLVSPELADAPGADGAARVVVAKPHEAMLRVLPALYRPAPRVPGVHPTAVLGRGVSLGAEVTVGPYAVIGDGAVLGDRAWIDAHAVLGAGVRVGPDSRVFPHATLYPGTELGARVAVHAGARLGSDGFGYVFGEGQHRKIPHVGRCLVEDDVEIGANTTIDRGSIGDTVIGAGTKIDNLVQLGHNVRLGRLCLVMAQVGVAGSASIEDGVILAGQAGLGGHITVGKGARIGGQAGVFGDVPAGATYSGYPARPHKEALRAQATLFRLAGIGGRALERLLKGGTPEDAR